MSNMSFDTLLATLILSVSSTLAILCYVLASNGIKNQSVHYGPWSPPVAFGTPRRICGAMCVLHRIRNLLSDLHDQRAFHDPDGPMTPDHALQSRLEAASTAAGLLSPRSCRVRKPKQ